MGCPLCHFEFLSDDPDKCKQFYYSVFGWEFNDSSMPEYTMINTGSQPGGGLMKRPAEAPSPSLTVYFLVDDIGGTLEKIRAGGGAVHMGETEIPNVGWFAVASDPEGIAFAIFKQKQS